MGAGRNSWIGWGQEGTWGTAVAPTKFAELVSENIRAMRVRTPRPVFRDLDVREGHFYDEKFGAAGPFSIEVNYEGLLRLLEHLTGGTPTTVQVDAGVRWTHAFTLAAGELMTGKGLSFQVNKDLTNVNRLFGGKLLGMTLSVDPRRNTLIELDLVGKDMDQVGAAAPTFPTGSLYVAGHQATVEIDDVARAVDTVELVIENALDDDKRVIGSKQIAEPVRGGDRRGISGTIVADAVDADWTKLNAGTLFKLEILHQGAALGTGFYRFDVTALKCMVTEDPIQVGDSGIIKATIPFVVQKPTSGQMLQIDVHNAESAVA